MNDNDERIQQESGMNTINDGGPAFPVWELNGNGQPEMTGFGMTLRDYFAAKAMQSLISSTINDIGESRYEITISLMSYRMADAMLKARDQIAAKQGSFR